MAKPSLTVFFLCAGLGTRLRPLTDRIPKPIIPFLGKTAFARNVINVRRTLNSLPGLYREVRIICNAHHLAELVELEAYRLGITTFVERPHLLGTGGCLHNARSALELSDHFLVHNADLIHDIDLEKLFVEHATSGSQATLAAFFDPLRNPLSISGEGRLLGMHNYKEFERDAEATRMNFTGIALYRREFLRFCTQGVQDIKSFWHQAIQEGNRIDIMNVSGAPWYDFGVPEDLWKAARWLMEREGVSAYGYPALAGERPLVSNETNVALPAGLRNTLVLEPPGQGILSVLAEHKGQLIAGSNFAWPVED